MIHKNQTGLTDKTASRTKGQEGSAGKGGIKWPRDNRFSTIRRNFTSTSHNGMQFSCGQGFGWTRNGVPGAIKHEITLLALAGKTFHRRGWELF